MFEMVDERTTGKFYAIRSPCQPSAQESLTLEIILMSYLISNSYASIITIIEVVREKTNNLGFRPGPTQIGLYSHRRWLEAGKVEELYYPCLDLIGQAVL